MPAVVIVGCAGALSRNHGRPERRLRRALRAERGTIVGLLQSLEHLAADADRRLLRANALHLENAFRVVIAKLVAQPVSALGDDADAAPAPVADLKNP